MILLPKENMVFIRSFLFFFSSIYLAYNLNQISIYNDSKSQSVALDYIFSNYFSVKNLPYVGTLLMLIIIYLNIFVLDLNPSADGPSTMFGINDQIILLFSFSCIFFPFLPEKYVMERDFLFLFSFFLLIIFIFPQILTLVLSKFNISLLPNSEFRSIFLARPLSLFLNFTGYESVVSGEYIYFRLLDGTVVHLFIAERCSGFHSVVIFLSAFFSYLLTEAKKFEIDYLVLVLFGIFSSYIANLFRMFSIILIGHYRGLEAMDWAHANLGWLIFFVWMALFWHFSFRNDINSLG
tara:strand:- start:126 stop:1007 length:882 start_codon:yes stop_codon:yes gene_type:complete